MTMLEKIAMRLVPLYEQNDGPLDGLTEADAVLEELMEPDATMMRAGADASPMWQTDSPDTYAIAVHDVADGFISMIQAAKEGG